ncbi:glycosyltransferase [Candidatus Viridilinea mediisalina]|uniref:Glycosyltransferase subfamily 4-like N-terminal domain-containing protein n=1 Tax=Candidatus Viridilinea mediisalina TaxID=2024553 RepID=A0A2A6RME0_9CHLR|nr:glycosyltransferase [Candidatus Viridilinea mediisalina]PDW04030.1 hypothetical protein CJ255_05510 [Candidatus Viridilinea mediisalina]
MKQTVCLISFSPIAYDARVLRQIKFLLPHYDLIVLGYGDPPALLAPHPGVRWISIAQPNWRPLRRLANLGLFLRMGHYWSTFYYLWHMSLNSARDAQRKAGKLRCDVVHANEWEALPLAADLAQRNNCPLVFDAHEYSPLQFTTGSLASRLFAPAISYILHTYGPQVTASTTVCEPLAERYRTEFQLDPMVVMNAPEYREVEGADHPVDPERVRLIHHGAAMRGRCLETMIEIIALCDHRFSLDFMLIGNPAYVVELTKLAQEIAPNRVRFLNPVQPHQIQKTIMKYDLGFCYIYPSNYSYLVSLPNKFFDFIHAGLAVCIGPSPSMVALGQQYGFTVVAPSFAAKDVAVTLNALDAERITVLRRAARQAAAQLNAEVELTKLVQIYQRLLSHG